MITGLLVGWALVGLSLFNTILLLWLGLTLWLNADERDPGIVVASAGFLLGSLFFISHSALLLSDSLSLTSSNTLWLAVGMTPALLLPYVWYLVILWQSGFWVDKESRLRQRHRFWLSLATAALAIGFAGLVLLGLPYLIGFGRTPAIVWPLREAVKTTLLGIPLVAIAYPLYVLLCTALSLEALRSPARVDRMMGDIARRRARPWLIAASLLMLLVAVLIAAVVIWIVANRRTAGYFVFDAAAIDVIAIFDLATSLVIAGVVVLLGQAMTTYELFTGKILPSRGLARQWHRAIAMAAGYGFLMGGALALGLEPVVAVLVTALLMTVFFALLSWRAYVEWEHSMKQLRPFVASQHWYDTLVETPGQPGQGPDPFRALCRGLLNTEVAYLIPAGPTATFVAAQSYPANRPVPELGHLAAVLPQEAELISAVDPTRFGGATWAVPLWRERGLIGVLLFGPRRDDGLFTREQIEIARSTGERLIDAAASVALSRRLMDLQRQRMAATQILDQRTRRVLHDEVLPLIHTALLSLPSGQGGVEAQAHLFQAHQEISRLLQELPATSIPEIARMGLLGAIRRTIEIEYASHVADIAWQWDQEVERQAARLNPLAAETLYYAARELVRNAAKHALPADGDRELQLAITASVVHNQLRLSVEDNGAGMPAASATGQGLALHSTLMAVAGGSLVIESTTDQWTRVALLMPLPQNQEGTVAS